MSATRRFLIEIEHWNCPYFVQLSPESTPPEHRFQGGLLFTSSIDIEGRVLEPRSHEGRSIRLWVSAPSQANNPEQQIGLGWIGERAPQGVVELAGTLELRGVELITAVVCLETAWKYVRIDATEGDDPNVTAFSFARRPSSTTPHVGLR